MNIPIPLPNSNNLSNKLSYLLTFDFELLKTCEFSKNKGASELKTTWVDEEYDPNIETFYYVRVLENPTCRWSTWDAIKNNYEPRQGIDEIIQERAWSSPIWVSSK